MAGRHRAMAASVIAILCAGMPRPLNAGNNNLVSGPNPSMGKLAFPPGFVDNIPAGGKANGQWVLAKDFEGVNGLERIYTRDGVPPKDTTQEYIVIIWLRRPFMIYPIRPFAEQYRFLPKPTNKDIWAQSIARRFAHGPGCGGSEEVIDAFGSNIIFEARCPAGTPFNMTSTGELPLRRNVDGDEIVKFFEGGKSVIFLVEYNLKVVNGQAPNRDQALKLLRQVVFAQS